MWPIYDRRTVHLRLLKLSTIIVLAFVLTLTLFLTLQPQSKLIAASPAAFSCETVVGIPPNECKALEALYNHTNGSTWTNNSNWGTTETPCGQWYNVFCAGGHVITLTLHQNQLSGSLPVTFTNNLTYLQHLNLSGNQLGGELPRNWAQLSQLRVIFLSSNQFTGTIPTELFKLSKLQVLDLSKNRLTGTIPPEMNLPELQWLKLGENPLTGTIPSILGNLSNLRDLRLDDTRLSGKIPGELSRLTNLTHLNAGSNCLSGEIPPELGKLTYLEVLDLSYNSLSGPIPPALRELDNLTQLLLLSYMWPHKEKNCESTTNGSPTEELGWLGELDKLTILRLGSTNLKGLIPLTLANLSNLTELRLDNNQLSGEIPNVLCALTQLTTLTIDYNMLTAPPNCLSKLPPTWESTQTLPPKDVQVREVTTNAATLTWTPIQYQSDGGGYEVGYTSQPTGSYQIHGITMGKTANTYTVTNLCPGTDYRFAVRTYTPPHIEQYNPLYSLSEVRTATTDPRPPLQLLSIYVLALDSDLSGQYESLISALEYATAQDTSRLAVVLADRLGPGNTEVLFLGCGKRTRVEGLPDPATQQLTPSITEYNTADGTLLGAFIKWARQAHPAPQTIVTYIGHGAPLAPAGPAADMSNLTSRTPPITSTLLLSDGIFAVPGRQDIDPGLLTDETSMSLISPYALAEALRIATDEMGPITVLDIVHCFAASVEEFYELANPHGMPFAEIMIGSPNYNYSGGLILRRTFLAPQAGQTADKMAAAIVNAYQSALQDADNIDEDGIVNHPRLIVPVKSSQLLPIKRSVDKLAKELLTLPVEEMRKVITAAHEASVKYDTTYCDLDERPQDFLLDKEDALSDLADFASQVQAQTALPPTLTLAAAEIVSAVQSALAIEEPLRVDGRPWFARERARDWDFRTAEGISIYSDFNGITLTNPITLNRERHLSWHAYWYNPGANDNPHAYAFLQKADSDPNNHVWSDVLRTFWRDPGKVVTVKACATTLPSARFFNLYLPIIVQ